MSTFIKSLLIILLLLYLLQCASTANSAHKLLPFTKKCKEKYSISEFKRTEQYTTKNVYFTLEQQPTCSLCLQDTAFALENISVYNVNKKVPTIFNIKIR